MKKYEKSAIKDLPKGIGATSRQRLGQGKVIKMVPRGIGGPTST